jgi:hypothetical protein
MLVLYTLTPLLGALRNYSKYKKFQLKLFIRTPITYYLLHLLLNYIKCNNVVLYTLIIERWYFLIYKSMLSVINDDYNIKREKYENKYGLIYN